MSDVIFSVRDELVIQLRFDFAFTVVTEVSTTRIESPFFLSSPSAEVFAIDPENPSAAENLLRLHQTYVDGDCFDDGSLELRFSSGYSLAVEASPRFEAWTLTRSNGEMAVSLPGGGVTTFGSRH